MEPPFLTTAAMKNEIAVPVDLEVAEVVRKQEAGCSYLTYATEASIAIIADYSIRNEKKSDAALTTRTTQTLTPPCHLKADTRRRGVPKVHCTRIGHLPSIKAMARPSEDTARPSPVCPAMPPSERLLDRLVLERQAQVAKALAHPKRMEIVHLLHAASARVEAAELLKKAGISKTNLSQQMSLLTGVGLVEGKPRRGRPVPLRLGKGKSLARSTR
jgi:DNA-binding transcriptional ArsR family regulator